MENQQPPPRRVGDIAAIEQGMLGALITNPELIDTNRIKREWFATKEAWTVLDAMDALTLAGKPVSVPNLVGKLRDMTGGHDFMQSVIRWKDAAFKDYEVPSRVDFLKREYQLRQADKVLREIHREVKSGEFTPESATERLYNAVVDSDETQHCFTAAEAAKLTMKRIVESLEASSGTGITGISTGIGILDNITGGLNNGDLIIVAGRASMGKTSFDIGLQVTGLRNNVTTGFISAEMPVNKVAARVMSAWGRFNLTWTRSIPKDELTQARAMHALLESQKWLGQAPLHINDKPGITIAEVARQARQWKRLYDIKVLHVDYIQFLDISADARTPRHEKVGMIVKGLKNLAKELNIPVVALSQVSRAVEDRSNKRPMMSDLSDSSEIEKTADVVITLYRDEVYNQDSADKGIIELGVIKNRDGATGVVRAAWVAEHATVADIDTYHVDYQSASYR